MPDFALSIYISATDFVKISFTYTDNIFKTILEQETKFENIYNWKLSILKFITLKSFTNIEQALRRWQKCCSLVGLLGINRKYLCSCE